ncbi:transposase [uncultured Aureimonas sp.]|uniref:IS66-like element accessory protein TnpA n=1 Tax=uncultured Aureimonas sp. TaxID=1604662 RepID=UPI0025F55F51|nr:transposase [uncultured Aureimonas sp.]
MSMSCADAGTEPVRRFEVFTGGRRREWSDEAKAAIVAESYSGLESVSAVARRHGLGHSQLFTWRRQLRGPMNDADGSLPLLTSPSSVTEQHFVPVLVAAQSVEGKDPQRKRRPRCSGKAGPTIELEIDCVSVRIPKGTDPRTITAVIQALKGSS